MVYQIVEGVAELHAREFVAGTLVSQPHCAVYVDGHDNVVFFRRLQPSTSYKPRDFGAWPPEHWKLAFQGQLRTISGADADLLMERMHAQAGAPVAS